MPSVIWLIKPANSLSVNALTKVDALWYIISAPTSLYIRSCGLKFTSPAILLILEVSTNIFPFSSICKTSPPNLAIPAKVWVVSRVISSNLLIDEGSFTSTDALYFESSPTILKGTSLNNQPVTIRPFESLKVAGSTFLKYASLSNPTGSFSNFLNALLTSTIKSTSVVSFPFISKILVSILLPLAIPKEDNFFPVNFDSLSIIT